MSPEQAAGRLDQLGPRSDVYCLGATLYHLLTGHAPCEADQIGEVFQKVLAGEIPRPRTLNPRIAPALEAVCLKAMALKPEDRYESVEVLQADLERWLADEPVSAWREPLRVRAQRWMRRHRTAVTAAASILIVTTVGLGLAFQRERMNAERLARAKAVSDRRLDQTLQAIEDYYTGVSEDVLLGRKEFQDLRARLLEKPRQFYEQLTRELGAAPDERGRSLLAKGRSGLGRVMWLLGRHEEAKQEVEAAIGLYRNLVTAQPTVADYQHGLADSYDSLGIVQLGTGDLTGAAESYREAIAIFVKLVAAQPNVLDYQQHLATSYTNLGIVQYKTGDRKEAAESYRQAIAIRSKLVAAQPNVSDYQNGLAGSHTNLGVLQRNMGDRHGAADSYRQSIAIGSKLVAAQSNVPDYQSGLAKSYQGLGNLQSEMADRKAAAESYRQAITTFSKLAAFQPNVPDYQHDLASNYINLGALQSRAGDHKEAAESFRQAIAIGSKLVAAQSNVPDYQSGLAKSYQGLGNVQREMADRKAAAESYRQAIATFSKLVAFQPNVPDYEHGLASNYNNLGALQGGAGDHKEAAASFRQAIAIGSKLVAAQSNVPDYQQLLAYSYRNLSQVQSVMGEPKRAEESSRQAIGILTTLATTNADVPDCLSALGVALDDLGAVLVAQDRHVEAERAYRQAIERQRIAIEKAPQATPFRRFLSHHHFGLARTLRLQRRADEAAEVALQRRALWKNNPSEFYNIACELALCLPIARDEARKQALATEAVTTLRAAIAAGWNDAAHTSRDPDLATLRDRDDFRRLLAEMFDRGFPADPFAR